MLAAEISVRRSKKAAYGREAASPTGLAGTAKSRSTLG